MNLEDLNGKRIMHIDLSKRFKQKGATGIAFKIINDKFHKGMCLSNKLKRELDKSINTQEDYARLYAICIFYLIKDELEKFDTLIICNDELFLYVKKYLEILFKDSKKYFSRKVSCLSKLREITGDKNLRSYADNIANIYRKKALLKIHRKQRGVPLNIVEINYAKITEKWKEIDRIIKKV